MSIPSEPQSAPTAPSKRKGPSQVPVVIIFALLLVAAGGLGLYYYLQVIKPSRIESLREMRNALLTPAKLDAQYKDADGDLVADEPESGKGLNPDTLVVSTLEPNQETAENLWKDLLRHLADKTGKKVVLADVSPGGKDAMDQLKEGKVHLAALSTGAVPLAVNLAGFRPAVVPANDEGKFGYQMEILVQAASPIRSLKDIKGKKVTLTSFSSLSSCRAPIETLYREQQFLPGRDYDWSIAAGQAAAIKALCRGEVEVIAVANDLLARVVEDPQNKLDKSAYRSIHTSETYPPFCVGYAHDLEPGLARKIREALVSFRFKDTSMQSFLKANQTRFVEIDYKKDWESVRKVDDKVREMLEKHP